MNQEVPFEDYLVTDDPNDIVSKLPAKLKRPTITLSRLLNNSLDLAAWHAAVRQGNIAGARKSVSLVFFNATGVAIATYFLDNAWPSKIEVSMRPFGRTEALTETVTLVSEYMVRVAP